MDYYLYILFSDSLNRYYTGTTNDVARRLKEHNNLVYANAFTSKGIPWRVVISYKCSSSKEAYALERFIKRMKSRKFIEKVLNDHSIISDIIKNKL